MQASLSGKAKVAVLVAVKPARADATESLSTLTFAARLRGLQLAVPEPASPRNQELAGIEARLRRARADNAALQGQLQEQAGNAQVLLEKEVRAEYALASLCTRFRVRTAAFGRQARLEQTARRRQTPPPCLCAASRLAATPASLRTQERIAELQRDVQRLEAAMLRRRDSEQEQEAVPHSSNDAICDVSGSRSEADARPLRSRPLQLLTLHESERSEDGESPAFMPPAAEDGVDVPLDALCASIHADSSIREASPEDWAPESCETRLGVLSPVAEAEIAAQATPEDRAAACETPSAAAPVTSKAGSGDVSGGASGRSRA